jgi:predicted NACHT family NTPase
VFSINRYIKSRESNWTSSPNADVIEQPLSAIIQIPDRAPLSLPIGATISDIFDAHAGSLLILGEPGTGKTTVLLELLRELLNRAEQDGTYPIPAVFNLSAWAARQLPLAQWLVAELNERSGVPKRVARRWVETEQIIPLLDGLDEVARGASPGLRRSYKSISPGPRSASDSGVQPNR